MRWLGWIAVALTVLAVAGFGLWRWAIANDSVATLEWIDARFARDHPVQLAVRAQYGADPAQHLELWVPESANGTAGRFPLIVFYHGGGWHSGTPRDYRFVARTLGEHGFATALVGYRLVPEGKFPNMLHDSAAGLAWLAVNAGEYGVAADRAVLAGHSAGAYNAAMLALDPRWLEAAGAAPAMIAGVAGLAGPYDFYPFDRQSAVAALGHVEPPQRTQPIRFARSDAPPLLLMTGTHDDVVRPRNSVALNDAIETAGGRSEIVRFDGMGHGGIIMALSRPFAQEGRVTEPLVAFARAQLAPPISVPTSADVQGQPR